MKRFAIAAVTAVAVLALFVAALPFIIPGSFVRDIVASKIAAWTGRTVVVAGEPRISIYPELAITVDNVTISNPDGMGDEAFVTAEGVRASMRGLPLLTGRIEFQELDLIRPRFRFVVQADGTRNWDVSGSSLVRLATRAVEAAREAAAQGGVGQTGVESPLPVSPESAVRLGRFAILDGTVLYDDPAADRREELTDVDFEMLWPLASGPASGHGAFVWRGETVQVNGSVREPLALIAGVASPIRLALAASTIKGSFAGDARLTGEPRLSGSAALSTPSLRRALTWLGAPMDPGATLDAASITGAVTVGSPGTSFDRATMWLDGNQATGSLSFALGDERPVVAGRIAADRLDLTAYVEAARADVTGTGPWLIAPTRLPYADALDADLAFSTAELIAGPARLGNLTGRLRVNTGSVELTVDGAEASGGRLTGEVRSAMIGEEFVFDVDAEVSGVPVRDALADIAGIEGLDGTGAATVKLGARGATWGEFARSLTGTSSVTLTAGSIALDVAAIAAAMSDPLAEPIEPQGGTTPFSTLTATLAISGGILKTEDLAMEGPTATVALVGSGSVVTGLVEGTARVIAGGDDAAVAIAGGWRQPVVSRGAAVPTTGAEAAIRPQTGG